MFNGELSLQLPASRTAALVATLVVATLGDVLFARLLGIILNFCHFLSDLKGLTLEFNSEVFTFVNLVYAIIYQVLMFDN